MNRLMRFAGFLSLLAVILGWEYIHFGELGPEWLEGLRDEFFGFLQAPWIHKSEVLCRAALVLGMIISLWWPERTATSHLRNGLSGGGMQALRVACLLAFISIGLFMYFARSEEGQVSGEPIAFLWGLFLSQGALVLIREQATQEGIFKTLAAIMDALLVVILFCFMLQPHWPDRYQYFGETRWLGPWRTPNTFGLLMGVGFVLSAGQCLWRWKFRQRNVSASSSDLAGGWRLRTAFYLIAAGLTGIGLIMSYSRGAWLGVVIGLGCFVLRADICSGGKWRLRWGYASKRGGVPAPRLIVLRHQLMLGMIVVSLIALTLMSRNCRFSEFRVVRRALSVCNANDFSWRNRLQAYEGALQMMAARPWFGYGWERPKSVYDQFYRPDRITEGAVIELNDYFMTGMMFGLPALACFVGYLALTLAPGLPRGGGESPRTGEDWLIRSRSLQMCCWAGAITLLVGFWIDRGLYWVVLSVPFWLLLELGATGVVLNERRVLNKRPIGPKSDLSVYMGSQNA